MLTLKSLGTSFLAATLMMVAVGGVQAATNDTYWDHSPISAGQWQDSLNWTAGIPTDSHSAYVDNGGTGIISGIADVRYLYVGYANNGEIYQDTGRLSPVWEVHLGYHPGASGRYELTNTGEIANYYQDLFVGFYGTGEFVQSGQSDSSMGDIELGRWEDSNGTYELTDATLAAQQLFVGRDGTGVFTQNSGTVSVTRGSPTYLRVGYGYWGGTGQGVYELKSGNLDTHTVLVGNGAVGVIKNTGGRHSMDNYDMHLGNDDFSTGQGTYELSGTGQLELSDEMFIGGLAEEGFGKFKQTGGSSEIKFVNLGTSAGAGEFEVGGATSAIRVGQFTQGENGTLISTVLQDGISTIEVAQIESFYGDGTARFDGRWQILDDGAPVGRWDVLYAAGGIVGSFDPEDVTLPSENWSWGIDGGALWVEKVPEPSTLVLFGAVANGLLGYAWRRRRRTV